MKQYKVIKENAIFTWSEEDAGADYYEPAFGPVGSYTVIVEDVDVSFSQQLKINCDAEEYLKSTDWYIIRESDTGKAVPEEIKTKRQEERSKIKR